jgi:hypothetical protein
MYYLVYNLFSASFLSTIVSSITCAVGQNHLVIYCSISFFLPGQNQLAF